MGKVELDARHKLGQQERLRSACPKLDIAITLFASDSNFLFLATANLH